MQKADKLVYLIMLMFAQLYLFFVLNAVALLACVFVICV